MEESDLFYQIVLRAFISVSLKGWPYFALIAGMCLLITSSVINGLRSQTCLVVGGALSGIAIGFLVPSFLG